MNSKMTSTLKPSRSQRSYSESYTVIRTAAESKWPAWKVSTYTSSVAVSAHAKKVAQK